MHHEPFWPPILRGSVDPANPCRIVLRHTGLDDKQWIRIGAALIVFCGLGMVAMLGIAGIHGFGRFVVGPIAFAVGVLALYLQLRERHRWCSLERRANTWKIETGLGKRVLKVSELDIRGATGRDEADDEDAGLFASNTGHHVLIYDALARYDETLRVAKIGSGLNLNHLVLEAIRVVLAEQAALRAAEKRVEDDG